MQAELLESGSKKPKKKKKIIKYDFIAVAMAIALLAAVIALVRGLVLAVEIWYNDSYVYARD